ncbi:MAG: hypothetical protein NW214_11530 [Pseudanabaenaceae cyanobacterium bins.39]|nr:hypothetical protein [Pseudanabaenaceae cyanobacterium bins.39]
MLANISAETEDNLQEISSTLDIYEGEFKLILARCNYQDLRDRLIHQLQEIHPQPIFEIRLPRSRKNLYNYITSQIPQDLPVALSIAGLDDLEDRHAGLLDLNINREMFRKNCPYPIVWWINDNTHKQIIRTAPDFESWTTTLEFPIDIDELLTSLQEGSEALFNHVLAPSEIPFYKKLQNISQLGSIRCAELEIALKDLGDRGLNLEPRLQANLNFIRGLDALPPSHSPEKALQYLQASLEYWQQIGDLERSGVLLNQIGQLNYEIIDAEKYRTPNWEAARSAFQRALDAFEQSDRRDLMANVIMRLVVIAKRKDDWQEIERIIQKALPLHQEFHSYYLASDYRYLAEIAMQKQQWELARTNIKLALPFLEQSPEENQEWRNLYLLTLAQAEVHLGNYDEGLRLLLEAQNLGDTGHPQVLIAILQELRSLYTKQKQYLEAYVTKQEQYAIEQQYGFRGFIGAGRLQGKRSVGKTETDVATEIEASGRKQDLDELITRIAKPSYKLIVLYGKSGVGKSSLVNAGLIPQLEQTSFEGRDVCAIAIRVYTNWEEELEKTLSSAQDRSPLPPLQRGALDEQVPLSKGDAEGRGIEPMLVDGIPAQSKELKLEGIISKLQAKEAQNLRIVLIFDQFEEFFFVYYNQPTERRRFFEFIGGLLSDSQNLSSLKVVLSLREDYLHYLLECNQIESMAAIDQDILSKNVLYRVGNLKFEAAKSLIQTLTQKSRFYLEPELIEAIANDLKDDLGEVRPIELQVVGAQLQQEGIKTLAQYHLLGANPKSVLVERYLNDVIVDCGAENERLAKFLLFMLTDERGTRPLKTREELEKDLQDLLAEMQGDMSALDLVLDIVVRSGLVVLIPESPLDRYQLVHDYLAEFIRASQAPEMAKLQRELAETKETLRETVDRLSLAVKEEESAKLKARKRSRLAFGVGIVASVMAVGAGIAGIFAWQNSVNSQFSADSYELRSFLNADLELEALEKSLKLGTQKEQGGFLSDDNKMRLKTSMLSIIYDIREKEVRQLSSENENIQAFSADGKRVATTRLDRDNKTLKIKVQNLDGSNDIELKDQDPIYADENNSPYIYLSPNGSKLAIEIYNSKNSKTTIIKVVDLNIRKFQTVSKEEIDSIISVEFSPDAKNLVFISGGKAKLWQLDSKDVKLNKPTRILDTDYYISATFSPDGKQLALASSDNKIQIWDTNTWQKTDFKAHDERINNLIFSPKGDKLATASSDKTVKIWNTKDFKEIRTLSGHATNVSVVKFSHNGSFLISSDYSNTAKIWQIEDGKLLNTITGFASNFVFLPDSQQIVSSNGDNKLRIWNLTGREVPTFKSNSVWGRFLSISEDGKKSAWLNDSTINIVDMDSMRFKAIDGKYDSNILVSFSPDSKLLSITEAVYINGKFIYPYVKIFNLDGDQIYTLSDSNKSVSGRFSGDGGLIAIRIYDDNTKKTGLKILDSQGKELSEINNIAGISSFDLSTDGKYIVLNYYDEINKSSRIKLFNISKKKEFILAESDKNNKYSQVKFSPDSKYVAVINSNEDENKSSIEIWDKQGKKILKSEAVSSLYDVVFSPDSRFIASKSSDNTVQLLSISDNSVQSLKGHSGSIDNLIFARDSKHLVTTSQDKTIKIWSLYDKELYTLPLGIKGEISGGNISFIKNQDKLIWQRSSQYSGSGSQSQFKIWDLGYDNLKGLGCYWLQNSKKFDSQSKSCHEAKYKKVAALSLVTEARAKVISGYPDEAESIFLEAQKLDSSISFDPKIDIEPYLILKSERLAQEGKIKDAKAVYSQVQNLNLKATISANFWFTLCWNGILYDSAKDVIFACDNAVKLKPDNEYYFQYRAIAKAIAGQTDEAIADFENYLKQTYSKRLRSLLFVIRGADYLKFSDEQVTKWLEELREGKQPITDAKLAEWRQSEKRAMDN